MDIQPQNGPRMGIHFEYGEPGAVAEQVDNAIPYPAAGLMAATG
jgi:hypothetical protein